MIEPDDDGRRERRMTEQLDRSSVPDRPRRVTPRRLRYVTPAVAVVLVVLVAFAGGQFLSAYRAGSAALSTPDMGLPALPSALERDQAVAVVRSTAAVGRVDRADAKLMTYAEYLNGAGPVRTHEGDPRVAATVGFGMTANPDVRYLWVVAISGEVWPAGRSPVVFGAPANAASTPYPPYRWATFLVDAGSAQLIVVGDAGVTESWPPSFSSLPAHPTRH